MKSSLHSTAEILRHCCRLCSAWLALGLFLPAVAAIPQTEEATNELVIQSIKVNGKSLEFRDKEDLSLGSFPESIVFGFGTAGNGGKLPLRLRYMMEGYENS